MENLWNVYLPLNYTKQLFTEQEHAELLTLLRFELFSQSNLWSTITFIQLPIDRNRAT